MSGAAECANCGATIHRTSAACNRCGERPATPGGGQPRFSQEAKDAAVSLGGLLELYRSASPTVPYVGWCPAGALGVRPDGAVAWVADWGWMSQLEVSGIELSFDGKSADIATGELLIDPKP